MRCFFCDKEATGKVYTSIDGCKQEIDVCNDHMEEIKKFNFGELFDSILNEFRGGMLPMLGKCVLFGKTRVDPKFNLEHIVKCPACFDIFHKFMIPLMQDIHDKHHVKRNTAPLYRLRRDLEIAVKEERYEDASKIKDEIKKLEGINDKKTQ